MTQVQEPGYINLMVYLNELALRSYDILLKVRSSFGNLNPQIPIERGPDAAYLRRATKDRFDRLMMEDHDVLPFPDPRQPVSGEPGHHVSTIHLIKVSEFIPVYYARFDRFLENIGKYVGLFGTEESLAFMGQFIGDAGKMTVNMTTLRKFACFGTAVISVGGGYLYTNGLWEPRLDLEAIETDMWTDDSPINDRAFSRALTLAELRQGNRLTHMLGEFFFENYTTALDIGHDPRYSATAIYHCKGKDDIQGIMRHESAYWGYHPYETDKKGRIWRFKFVEVEEYNHIPEPYEGWIAYCNRQNNIMLEMICGDDTESEFYRYGYESLQQYENIIWSPCVIIDKNGNRRHTLSHCRRY